MGRVQTIRHTTKATWSMPTLIRLIVLLLILAGLVFGGMIALVHYVNPEPHEITVRIPSDRFNQ